MTATPAIPSSREEILHAVHLAELAAELETFIRERFRVRDDDTFFSRTTNLWEEGYVDSAGVVEVLAFLEERIGARLPEDLLFEPDFASIEGMARISLEHAP
jgi:acyl carrier protein